MQTTALISPQMVRDESAKSSTLNVTARRRFRKTIVMSKYRLMHQHNQIQSFTRFDVVVPRVAEPISKTDTPKAPCSGFLDKLAVSDEIIGQ
jgi:hypothetical protein